MSSIDYERLERDRYEGYEQERMEQAENSRFARFVQENERGLNPAPRIAFDWWRVAIHRGQPVDETDALLLLVKTLLEQNQEQHRLLMEAHQNRPIVVQVPDGRMFGPAKE